MADAVPTPHTELFNDLLRLAVGAARHRARHGIRGARRAGEAERLARATHQCGRGGPDPSSQLVAQLLGVEVGGVHDRAHQ